jgi:hypothetical protein
MHAFVAHPIPKEVVKKEAVAADKYERMGETNDDHTKSVFMWKILQMKRMAKIHRTSDGAVKISLLTIILVLMGNYKTCYL